MNKLKNLLIAIGITLIAIMCIFLVPIILALLSILGTGIIIYAIYALLDSEDVPLESIESKEEEDT